MVDEVSYNEQSAFHFCQPTLATYLDDDCATALMKNHDKDKKFAEHC
jgi:hypothetical protein